MFGLGLSEIIFLAIIALVVIGPKQLPEVARTLGRFLNELRRTTTVMTEDLKSHMRFDPLDLNKPIDVPKNPVIEAEITNELPMPGGNPDQKDPS
jgi:sec-independent protein translocase protein TatB